MALVQVSYCSTSRLACSSCLPADVILCIPAEFIAPHLCPEGVYEQSYEYRHIEASLVAAVKSVNCAFNALYTYTFEFDNDQLVEDSGFLSSDITGVFCKGCLTNWVEDIVGDEIQIDVGDYEVTITSQHGCQTSFEVGGASAGWELLGNEGTVEGTNFLGTTDDIDLEFRINNQPVYKFQAPLDYVDGCPSIVANPEFNVVTVDITQQFDGNAILSGGGATVNANKILDTGDLVCSQNVIVGGFGHHIDTSYGATVGGGVNGYLYFANGSVISGGFNNTSGDIALDPQAWSYADTIAGGEDNYINKSYGTTISGGASNSITSTVADTETQLCTVAGGYSNIIEGESYASVISGGDANEIAESFWCTVGGGSFNQVKGTSAVEGSTVCGGNANSIGWSLGDILYPSYYDFIGGGSNNALLGTDHCTIVGGANNLIDYTGGAESTFCFIGGGYGNTITDSDISTISGGQSNSILGDYSAIPGGGNLILSTRSFGFQSFIANIPGSDRDLSAFSDIAYFGDVDVWVANSKGTATKLKFIEPNSDIDYSSANYSSFQAQTQASNIEYVLPATAGVAGQSLRIQSVAGPIVTLEWA